MSAAAPLQHCVPRVASEDDDDEDDDEDAEQVAQPQMVTRRASGSSQRWAEPPAPAPEGSPRRYSVRFTDVTVLHHEQELDESKLPSDGLAPIGLGALQRKEIRRLDSYEQERMAVRTGVGIVPPEERRQTIGVKRAASVERIENDNHELKRAHVQSVREHIRELRAAHAQSAQQSHSDGAAAPAATSCSAHTTTVDNVSVPTGADAAPPPPPPPAAQSGTRGSKSKRRSGA